MTGGPLAATFPAKLCIRPLVLAQIIPAPFTAPCALHHALTYRQHAGLPVRFVARPEIPLTGRVIGVALGRGQNDTLRKMPLGVPVEPIGFSTSKPLFLLSQHLSQTDTPSDRTSKTHK